MPSRTLSAELAATREERDGLREVLDYPTQWHTSRFPTATVEHAALKLAEEAGEVCAAVIAMSGNEHPERATEVVAECADVFIVLAVLVGRYSPEDDLVEAVKVKMAALSPEVDP